VDLESGHRLVSPSVDPLRDLGLAKISRLVQVRGISESANIFRNRILAPSASTDVQTLVELLIELLLLAGCECMLAGVVAIPHSRRSATGKSRR